MDKSSKPATGAVYIYRGNQNPEKIKLSQKILAKDVKLPEEASFGGPLKTFGYSLSGGIDMDANSYPDLLIGSISSNAAIVLRTLPLIHLKSYVLNIENLQEIDQKIKQCKKDAYSNDFDTVCFSFEVCFELDSAKNSNNQIINNLPLLNYTMFADSNVSTYSRVYFNSTNTNMINSLIKLNVFGRSCQSFFVYIKQDNYDFLRSIKFYLSYQFSSDGSISNSQDLSFIKNYPMVHEDSNKYEFEVCLLNIYLFN